METSNLLKMVLQSIEREANRAASEAVAEEIKLRNIDISKFTFDPKTRSFIEIQKEVSV